MGLLAFVQNAVGRFLTKGGLQEAFLHYFKADAYESQVADLEVLIWRETTRKGVVFLPCLQELF